MDRRGVELSMNVIIIAAIALIVLVVLVILVTKGGIQVQSGTGCSSAGGTCTTLSDTETCQTNGLQSLGQKDCKADQLCCYTPPTGGATQ